MDLTFQVYTEIKELLFALVLKAGIRPHGLHHLLDEIVSALALKRPPRDLVPTLEGTLPSPSPSIPQSPKHRSYPSPRRRAPSYSHSATSVGCSSFLDLVTQPSLAQPALTPSPASLLFADPPKPTFVPNMDATPGRVIKLTSIRDFETMADLKMAKYDASFQLSGLTDMGQVISVTQALDPAGRSYAAVKAFFAVHGCYPTTLDDLFVLLGDLTPQPKTRSKLMAIVNATKQRSGEDVSTFLDRLAHVLVEADEDLNSMASVASFVCGSVLPAIHEKPPVTLEDASDWRAMRWVIKATADNVS